MEIQIMPAILGDAYLMAPFMREVDALEVQASGGLTPLQALTESVKGSDEGYAWTAFVGESPACMWGVGGIPQVPDYGIVWMLATDAMYQAKKTFWRENAGYIDRMHKKYPIMGNCVDARNTTTRRWLKRLGFKEITSIPDYGFEKREFIYIESNRNV